ncbi:MFS transporter, UMF1 family [Kytococcus aerolatus]|uniref:MFS transporter, UMF1 family n=1 Tax=Kytococcus aerolatus TaxID=592308 RepID=A0A212T226_9MICO|nr:MFS transporter, UMF1 family [Kytococcus aerolatus]
MTSTLPDTPAAPTSEMTRAHQRAWGWYDWANSAYVTTTGTVLIGPYLTQLASADACPELPSDQACTETVSLLGIPVAAGSLASYTVTLATIFSVVVVLLVGAMADRSPRPTRLLGVLAWVGSLAAMAMVLLAGTSWQLGVLLVLVANVCLGASTVVYDALLVRIAAPDDRDRVSSRAWAMGYVGGGLLLVANLAVVQLHESLGLTLESAVRLCLFSAGLWWALFTLIPVVGLRRLRGTTAVPVARSAGALGGSLRQLRDTFSDLRCYPQTLTFLLAYLFFNDGIQTVISSASIYGSVALGFETGQLMVTILLVQFVAAAGALVFGRLAARFGARRTILGGVAAWTLIVAGAYLVPRGAFLTWLFCAALIGLVMGGTQALSRSLYSQLVPRGRESEFFAFYQAMERGTSWFGTLVFGLVFQTTGSYRPAILALLVFFVVGGLLLARVDVRRGIADAGNPQPAVV